MTRRGSGWVVAVAAAAVVAAGGATAALRDASPGSQTPAHALAPSPPAPGPATARPAQNTGPAAVALGALAVRGRAPKTGYSRAAFGAAWADVDRNGCDTRDDILRRDLHSVTVRPGTHGCLVVSGTLAEPYTGRTVRFTKAQASEVQIDHVVALSDSWQKGAQQWSPAKRRAFANDPLNLLAVDGPSNQQKSDGDAATWLPANKVYRCAYVARQVAVKSRFGLWVTAAEQAAMTRVLATCPGQPLPTGGAAVSSGLRELPGSP